MKVVILATAIGPLNRGIGQYERSLLPSLLSALAAQGCEGTVILSRGSSLPPPPSGFRYATLPVPAHISPLRFIAEQCCVPYWSAGADAFLSLDGVFPFSPVFAKRKIVVVHDIHVNRHVLDPKGYPEDYSWRYKLWASAAHRRAIKAADHIIAVSNFTASEIGDVMHVPHDRITVAPNGVDQGKFQPVEDRLCLEELRRRYNLPASFYLYVGPYSRKKNLRLIVDAYAAAKCCPDFLLPVVVVGSTRREPLYLSTMGRVRETGLGGLFHFLGPVADEELVGLYTAARALIYPSLYEGFGLPVLEAMACGTPVVGSSRSSVPEVVGGAAILVDPTSPETLIDALRRLTQEEVRNDLVARGFEQARQFTWNRTADLVSRALCA